MILAIRTLPSRPRPLAEVSAEFMDDVVYGEQLGLDFAWISVAREVLPVLKTWGYPPAAERAAVPA